MTKLLDSLWDETLVYKYFDQRPDRDYFAQCNLYKDGPIYVQLRIGPRQSGDFLAVVELVNINGEHMEAVVMARASKSTLLATREELGKTLNECLETLSVLVEATRG